MSEDTVDVMLEELKTHKHNRWHKILSNFIAEHRVLEGRLELRDAQLDRLNKDIDDFAGKVHYSRRV